ncbi:putative WD40 repeat-like protein [Lyophyllum shimeji]|uniref:WD40 repeat-like protein n=1 Tax=Lyophyllum shimeji TaxID=47721 RepID=A0A9P3PRP6_LYOSH|nr:putative WD40 repeat-like protein [Lyophyllum shimeji]
MKIDPTTHSQTLYIPIASPPTPSPSPAPVVPPLPFPHSHAGLTQPAIDRRTFLTAVLRSCTPAELHFVAESLAPLLKRDFLSALPPELNLHILSFIDDPRTLVRTGAVSRAWRAVASAEIVWKRMCVEWGFGTGAAGKQGQTQTRARVNRGGRGGGGEWAEEDEPLEEMEPYADLPMDAALEWLTARKRRARRTAPHDSGSSCSSLSQQPFSYRMYFRECYIKVINWERGGHRLRAHYLPMLSSSQHQQPRLTPSPLYSASASTSTSAPTPALAYHNQQQNQQDSGVVTSLALDSDWVVVGLASSRIHVFSAQTGVLARTLVGHDSGVWGLCLVSASRNASGSGTGKGKGKGKERARAREEDVLLDLGELSLDGGGAPKHRRTRSARTRGIGGEDVTEDGRYQLLPPALRAAVGLPVHSDGEATSDDDEDGDDEDGRAGVGGRGIVDEDKEESYSYRSRDAEHQARHRGDRDAPPDSDPTTAQYVPERQSDPCFASEGWGQPNALVISGGCDKVVRVWDVKSGHCIYTLPGHTSTIRCMRTVHGRPLAVTGSRDGTVRTWDVQRGRAMRVLAGHTNSVRCLDVNGSRAASGSYDTTCRIWDLDTGECLHVLRGHYHQVYTVAFDGVLVATGGLDTTVRLWNADTGLCVALLQGHTSLVSQLQISRRHQLLVTGGSDGRIITFSLAEEEDMPVPAAAEAAQSLLPLLDNDDDDSIPPSQSSSSSSSSSAPFPPPPQPQPRRRPRAAYQPLYGISAHESSVTSLQFDGRFLVTGSNDGRVRLFETMTGRHVRDMWEGGECVWKVGFTGGGGRGRGRECAWDWQEGEGEGEGEDGEGVGDVCVFVGRRGVKTVLEVWGFGER